MQDRTRYPLILRVLTGLGRASLGSLIILVFIPLVNAYGIALDIPLLGYLTVPLAVAAILVLFLSVPLSWGLGCAGLMLEWLARHKIKRKRKLKRGTWAEDRGVASVTAQRTPAQRLAEPRDKRLKSTSATSVAARRKWETQEAVGAAIVDR